MLSGNAAYDNELAYLQSTKKPMSLSKKDWIRWIQVINNVYLCYMGLEAETLAIDELVKQEVIKPNIPASFKETF